MTLHNGLFAVIALCTLLLSHIAANQTRPNFLIVLADDCSYRGLDIHDGQAKTPHLKRLAAQGMMFTRCFQSAPMCSPTMQKIYAGLYPLKSGAYPKHAVANDDVRSMVHHLGASGYHV